MSRRTLAAVLAFALLPAANPTLARGLSEAQYLSEASVISNLPNFVEWPEGFFSSAEAPFVICAIGDFSLQNLLDKMSRNRTVRHRPVAMKAAPKENEWSSCQILVISRQEKKRYAKIIQQLQGASVPTLGETPDFVGAGGMVTMLLGSGTNVQFEVNLDATDKAGLKISAALLSLALRVVQTKTAAAKS